MLTRTVTQTLPNTTSLHRIWTVLRRGAFWNSISSWLWDQELVVTGMFPRMAGGCPEWNYCVQSSLCSWIKPKHWATVLFLPLDSREVYIYSGLPPDETMASFKAFGVTFASTSLCYLNKDRTQVRFGENMAPCWVLVMIKYITLYQRLSSLQFGRLWVSDILNIIIHTVIVIVKTLLLFAVNSGSIVSCKHAGGSEKLYCFFLLSDLLLSLTLMSNFIQDCLPIP